MVSAGFAASAFAATIRGTAKSDTIRGTPKADTIYGLAGNDTIYGLGGNDKIYGGAGNDHLFGGPGNDTIWGGTGKDVIDCGPGHDTVYADAQSTVKSNCEVVHRTGNPPPPPPPTTTAPTTTTTSSGPQVQQGHYCGFTSNSGGICFDITGSPIGFSNATFETSFDNNDCSPAISGTWDWTTTGAAPLSTSGAFDFHIASGPNAGTDVSGTVASDGTASGTITIRGAFQDNSGNSYNCSLNGTWTATLQR